MTIFIFLCYHTDMKEDFLVHNLFWQDINQFNKLDPQLSRLKDVAYVHRSRLETAIPITTPGIYILTGSRQVGKSTLLKLIIKNLLKKNFPPNCIFYLPCDTITDFRNLLFEIEQFIQTVGNNYFVLFLDEVTYVKEWDRAIKSLADAGLFRNGSVTITGSDSYILKEAMMRFPGRRGEADEGDFHLHPLSFHEYVFLRDVNLSSMCNESRTIFENTLELKLPEVDQEQISTLAKYFGEYLFVGGFMSAINDFAKNGRVSPAVYKTYTQWIVGDFLKRGKQENYLREIVEAIIPRLSKQITWHNLSGAISIDHHQTVLDYINLFARMDAINIIPALKEDKFQASPKKAKKVCFSDPFILHTLNGWIKGRSDSFELSSEILNTSNDLQNALIEGVVASHFGRKRPIFYIKADGEVDVAVVKERKFFPIEIKNSKLINKRDLKQILKYQRGLVGYSGNEIGKFEQLDVVPIPLLALIAAE